MYADDICCLASSFKGLQKLLDICCDYANNHDITFKCTKTKTSSVATGGGGGLYPPIGMSIKMQNGKNTKFLALLRLFYALQ